MPFVFYYIQLPLLPFIHNTMHSTPLLSYKQLTFSHICWRLKLSCLYIYKVNSHQKYLDHYFYRKNIQVVLDFGITYFLLPSQ